MLSSVINSLRVFRGLYDLTFSEDQFFVEQRAEFLGRVLHCIERARRVFVILHLREYTSGNRL
jgi:hypothetical protein